MSEQRIDDIVDVGAVNSQVDAAKTKVQELVELIKKVKASGIDISTTHTVKEYQALRRELDLLTKQTDQAAKAAIAEAKVRQANANAVKAETAATQQSTKAKATDSKLTKDLTNEHKLLSLAVADAQKKYFNLAITQGRLHPLSVQALADANAYKAKLVQLNQDVKTFNDNVGNYGNSTSKYLTNLADSGKKAFSIVRTAANILPGLGLSGAFLLIFEGVASAAEQVGEMFVQVSEKTKTLRTNLKSLNEANEKGILNAVEERVKLGLLVDEYEDVTTSAKRKKQIQEELQNDYPAYLGNLKTEKEFAEGLGDAYNKLSQALGLKAKTQALSNLITENETNALKLEIGLAKDLGSDQFAVARRKVAQETIKQLRSTNALLIHEALNTQSELDKIGGDPTHKDEKQKKEKQGRDLAEADRKADFEREKNRLTTIAEINNKIAADNERHIAERQAAAFKAFIAETDLIQLTAEFESKAKGLTKKEIFVITEKANQDLLKAELKYYESLAKAQKDFNKIYIEEDEKLRKELEKGIDEAMKKFEKDLDEKAKKRKKDAEDAKKTEEDNLKTTKDLASQLAKELTDLTFTLLDRRIELQKNAIAAQIDNVDKLKAKNIEIVNQSILSEQDKAAKIAIIEARALAEKEGLQRKQKELDIKKAKFDKAQSIAHIVQSTAEAIIKYAGIPIYGTALAVLAAAIGAAQLAIVISQPIPQYKHGTKGHPGGPAIVGDGGKAEGITLPDGTVIKSPSHSTLMDLPEGTQVHPDFNKMMLTATMTKPVQFAAKSYSDSSAKVVSELKEVKKAIYKIPQTSIEVTNPLRQRIRYGHSINEHLTRNLGK